MQEAGMSEEQREALANDLYDGSKEYDNVLDAALNSVLDATPEQREERIIKANIEIGKAGKTIVKEAALAGGKRAKKAAEPKKAKKQGV